MDTVTKKVAEYSYDLTYRKVEFKGAESPDRMDIDENGMLWIAEWGGVSWSIWNPLDGEKVEEIKLPCTNITSCGIDNCSNLYITTVEDSMQDDTCGSALFYVELNKI